MIVAFSDRRRLSDGSHSNVVRKSSHYSSAPGQMIVAFADRRRPSDGSRRRPSDAPSDAPSDGSRRRPSDADGAHSHLSRKMERCPSGPSLRRNKVKGGPSRKQTSPAPMKMDPPIEVLAPRRTKAVMEPEGKVLRSRREIATAMATTMTKQGRSSTRRYSRSDVIVGFPERNPGLWGSLRAIHGGAQRESRTSSCPMNQPEQKPRHDRAAASRKTQDRHTRQFEDAVDWRQTSIDWGDEDEENVTDDGSSDGDEPLKPRQCRSQRNGTFHCSQTTMTSAESLLLSQSISSLLSIRKLDDP